MQSEINAFGKRKLRLLLQKYFYTDYNSYVLCILNINLYIYIYIKLSARKTGDASKYFPGIVKELSKIPANTAIPDNVQSCPCLNKYYIPPWNHALDPNRLQQK